MYINVELQTALTAMRREEIRREVAAARLGRRARIAQAAAGMPGGVSAALLRLRVALAQALVPGTMVPPAA